MPARGGGSGGKPSLEERTHIVFGGFRLEPGQGKQNADLFADGGESFEFFAGEDVGLAMLDVDDADDFVTGDDGGREKCFVLVFGEFGEALEAGIEKGFLADGDEAALTGDPAGKAFVDAEADLAEGARGRVVRGAKKQVALIEEIEQAGIGAHELNDKGIDGGENLLEAEFLDHETADFLKQTQLLLSAVELQLQILYLRHSFIMAGRVR